MDRPALLAAILALHEFGIQLHDSSPPYYQTFVRSLTNGVLPLLGMCMVLAATGSVSIVAHGSDARFDFAIPDDEIWEHMMGLVHRAYHGDLLIMVEGMCHEYCGTKGITVVHGGDPNKAPRFIDYLETAMKSSSMADDRKKHWRRHFKALQVIRNKASHYNTLLTAPEQEALRDAGLQDHIGSTGHMQTNPGHYRPLAESVLAFARGLAASGTMDVAEAPRP